MDPSTVVVHSDGEIYNYLTFHVGNGTAPAQIQWKIRGDVSASKYHKIVKAVEEENVRFGRNDIISNPRDPPYQPNRSIRVRSIRELESVVQREGTAFCCLIAVPAESWDAYQSIAFKARELGVEVDTWTDV